MAKIEEKNIEKSYRIYITDSLHLFGENKHISKRWIDLIDSKKESEKEESRSSDEIAFEVIMRAGLSFGGEGGENI